MIPTTAMAVLSLIGIIIAGYFGVQVGWYIFCDWWMHRSFSVDTEYALHSKQGIDCKFITGGRH